LSSFDIQESKLLKNDENQVFESSELSKLKGGAVKKMNLYQAVNNALSTALDTDESASEFLSLFLLILIKNKFHQSII